MSFRTILVYLDSKAKALPVIEVASKLAQQHDAHVIGLYVVPPMQVYATAEMPVPVELTKSHLAYHDEYAATLQALFEQVTDNQGYVAEWRKMDAQTMPLSDAVIGVAHTVDLVVLGQKEPDTDGNYQSDIPERVLLAACRPVVVVPKAGEFKHVGRDIFVAWNASGEATRAVFDALPALIKANSVTLHMINPERGDRHRVMGTPAELVSTLSRHGVPVTLSQSDASSFDVGGELMQFARDKGADLIVMGVYGRSRLREILFGGASRKILQEMEVPVLMSH